MVILFGQLADSNPKEHTMFSWLKSKTTWGVIGLGAMHAAATQIPPETLVLLKTAFSVLTAIGLTHKFQKLIDAVAEKK